MAQPRILETQVTPSPSFHQSMACEAPDVFLTHSVEVTPSVVKPQSNVRCVKQNIISLEEDSNTKIPGLMLGQIPPNESKCVIRFVGNSKKSESLDFRSQVSSYSK